MVITGPFSCCTSNEEHSPQKHESEWTCFVVKSLGSSFSHRTFLRVTGLEGSSDRKRLTEVSNLLLKEESTLRTAVAVQGSVQSGLEALHGQTAQPLWASYFTTWLPSELKLFHISSANPSYQLISGVVSHRHFMCCCEGLGSNFTITSLKVLAGCWAPSPGWKSPTWPHHHTHWSEQLWHTAWDPARRTPVVWVFSFFNKYNNSCMNSAHTEEEEILTPFPSLMKVSKWRPFQVWLPVLHVLFFYALNLSLRWT